MFEDIPLILEREAGMPDHVSPVAVGFGFWPLEDEAETAKRGAPFYRDVEFFRCMTPGDKNAEVFQPATEQHRRRFPKAYAMFRENGKMVAEGTPLQQWAMLSRADVLNLRAMGIHSMEMLAAVNDDVADRIGHNGRDIVVKAKAWLQQAQDAAAVQKIASEKEELQATIAQQQATINELVARLDRMENKKKAA